MTPKNIPGLHNLSSYALTKHDVDLLTKGLSFAPTANTTTHELNVQTLTEFNEYAKSLRLKYLRMQYKKHLSITNIKLTIHRPHTYRDA